MPEKIGRITCTQPSMTQQSPKDECDINVIVERAKRGEDLSRITRTPIYGDFRTIPSYKDALQIVINAQNAFNSLDAFVRERFQNDPARMVDFLNDPKNRDEAVRLGLVNPPPVSDSPQPSAGSSPKTKKGDKPAGAEE